MGPIYNLIKKHRLIVVLLAAVLTTVSLMLLVRAPDMAAGGQPSIVVEEQNGVFDLTGVANLKETAVILPPGPAYYPSTLLTPETADTAAPESTSRYDALRADYLSQRFLIRLPRTDQVYTLTFKVSGRHAFRVYANGAMVGQSGHPDITKQGTEVWENNITCYAAAADGIMDILLNSAQFYHYKSGARLAALTIRAAGADAGGLNDKAEGFLAIGALLCAAVLLFCIYLLLQRNRATLFFSLTCMAMALRACIQSQAWTSFPFISGNLSFMLEYLSVVLLAVFLSFYLGQYAKSKFLKAVQYTAIIGSVVYGLVVLLADSVFYTYALRYYQALLIICIVPGIAGLFFAMRRPTGEQAAALYGIAVFYIAAISDILMYNGFFGSAFSKAPISEASMLVFALAQTVSLFFMNNRLFTQAKEAERRLAAQKEALENLNRLKTEFLANVSHELKTPLTVVSGHAQISRSQLPGPENQAVRERMAIIASEADRLALMVGQFLDVTRIEEGRMALNKQPCHIDELIYRAVETHFPVLNKNGNRLEIKPAADLPAVNVDAGRITQVLVNLIANAARHTVQGMITVAAQRADGFVEVSVADTGAGIAPEDIPRLFTRFQSRSADSKETGTGLGLYICRHIVEEHGGEITVESAPGAGTKIVFSLPLK